MPISEFFKKISDKWHFAIGSAASFSIEARIFHSISIGLVILATVDAPYDFYEGLYIAGISALALSAFFIYQFYISRFRSKAHNSTLFALTGILVFSLNYFSNAGINGSTDIIWPTYLLLVLVISPYRQHILWVTVYITAFFMLHVIEYQYPSLVQHPFDLGKGQFIDRVTAFPLPVIAIAIIIAFIKRNYDKERATGAEKATAIEARNELITLQKDQLERSDAEKNKLLSIISHDMRAPFANIQAYLQLLNENRLDNEERHTVESELLNATDQTMEMLSNLLYWSRSQMKGASIDLAKTDLLTTLNNTLEIEKMLAAKKGITLTYQIDADITVIADANMMQIVMRNIISNAIKFTRQGGLVNIRTRIVNNECEISIADNGIGISTAQKDTLFSMTSGSTFGTNNEKGVGLGLTLCKEFMEQQGGHISFESTQGKGSIFFVYIPLSPQS